MISLVPCVLLLLLATGSHPAEPGSPATVKRFALDALLPDTVTDHGTEADQRSGGAQPGQAAHAAVATPRPEIGFEQWLEQLVRARCPGLTKLWFERSAFRTYSSAQDRETISTVLAVEGDPPTFAAVQEVLDALSAQNGLIVNVALTFVRRTADAAAPEAPPTVLLLPAADADRELADAKRTRSVLEAPTVSVFPAQRLNVRILEQTSCITDYQMVAAGGRMIADPTVEVINEGETVTGRAFVHPDRRTVSLVLDVQVEWAVRPIPTTASTLGTTRIELQSPQVKTSTWRSGLIELEAGSRVLRISGLKFASAKDELLPGACDLLVRVTVDASLAAALPQVIAFDEVSDLVVARLPQRANESDVRSELRILRGGRMLATVRIERIEGSILLGRRISGEAPRTGDLLQ